MTHVPSTPGPRISQRVIRIAATVAMVGATASVVGQATAGAAPSAQGQLSSLHNTNVASVVAPNGDQNPYGIAIVPQTVKNLVKGNILVADFNNKANTSGAGTTILQVNPMTGTSSVFYQDVTSTGPVGIAINPVNDIVWLGDYGTATNGTSSNVLVILPSGKLKTNFNSATTSGTSFVGVWGQAVSSVNGSVSFYWGNAGNATTGNDGGSVWRVSPGTGGSTPNGQPLNSTYAEIGSAQAATPAGGSVATAAGPQGMVFDSTTGTLYETNSADNTLYAIPTAATATGSVKPVIVYQGGALVNPNNVVINPLNGDLLVVNGGNNNLVEITPTGHVVATVNLAVNQPSGALFGLAATTDAAGNLVVYYVNDNENSLHALTCLPGHTLYVAKHGKKKAHRVAPACAIR